MDTADYDTGFTTEFTAWTVPPELAVYPWDDAHPADRLKPGVDQCSYAPGGLL